jgi:hypothetical protein
MDTNDTPLAPAVCKFHNPGHLGEESIVFAAADVVTGKETRPALPHQDRAARDQLSRKSLYAQPL